MNIGILNYTVGNIKNLENFFNEMKFDVHIIDDSNITSMSNLDGIVLPGVGAFNSAMNFIKKNNIKNEILNFVKTNKPILGICLGFQVLFKTSVENIKMDGLGLINGNVIKLSDFENYKNQVIPHIGWNSVKYNNVNKNFYFLHKYGVQKIDNEINCEISYTDYMDLKFISMVRINNIMGTQFHPERSDVNGIDLINNFFREYEKI